MVAQTSDGPILLTKKLGGLFAIIFGMPADRRRRDL